MPDTDSLVIGKSFNYRGAAETWTNKYHLEGTTPTTRAEWLALAIAVWDSEKTFIGSNVEVVTFQGYQAGNEAAKFMAVKGDPGFPTNTAGSASGAGTVQGDVSLWLRWSTPERNSKNKPIYLRKYYHGVPESAGNGDTPLVAARTAMQAHGAKMISGTLPGGMKVCGPQGADAANPAVAQYFTTRTLKRNARSPT